MAHRLKTWLNADDFPHELEENTEKSLTVPNQSLTIPKILENYTRGLPLNNCVHHDGLYDDDSGEDEDDWNVAPDNRQNKDLTDSYELEQELRYLNESSKKSPHRDVELDETVKKDESKENNS